MIGPWYSATAWRAEQQADMAERIEQAALQRAPKPPAERFLRVRATRSNWRMAGRTVDVGTVYSVSENEAHRLAFTGKGELA